MIRAYILRNSDNEATIKSLKSSPLVSDVVILDTPMTATSTLRAIAADDFNDEFTLLYTGANALEIGYQALDRFVEIAAMTGAGLLYSDYYTEIDGEQQRVPTIDYQEGSLRDDFNFGSVLFYRTSVLREAAAGFDMDFNAAGLYDLRLRASRLAPVVHVNEYLYSDVTTDNRKSGEKLFDYVDPRNRASQIEMEKACTAHLKAIGAYLEPRFKDINIEEGEFPVEASVIIPVRNRVKTIADAVKSALSQTTDFAYNVIVIDNHSTDGTSEILENIAAGDPRLIHLRPERNDLGIGGCWNFGVNDPRCGKFAVQLDSDDIYSDRNTLAKVVAAFKDLKCGMVVGTYSLTDFHGNPLPPGVIDHREWTPDNGRNNALRINGLGAPRAFYTPLLRKIHLPNTSYGEDYAVALAISREHQIGRIYDVLYLCRRWEGNSDSALSIDKVNANNLYKDRIRTWEVAARRKLNAAE